MLAVAVRADGDVLDALDVVLAVDALEVVPLDPDVAAAAGLDDVLAGHAGPRVARRALMSWPPWQVTQLAERLRPDFSRAR